MKILHGIAYFCMVSAFFVSIASAGPTPDEFIDAATKGDEKAVSAMLAKSSSLAKATNMAGVPVLVLCVGQQHPSIVEMLLKHGADPNDAGKGATTPMSVTMLVHVSVKELKALLDAGGNPNVTSSAFGQTPLMKISQTGDLESVKLLVAKKADVNAKDSVQGWAVLHYAAVSGDAEVVKFLLAHKAKVDATDKKGQTALALVSSPGNAQWAHGKDYKAVIAALRDASKTS